MSGDTGINLAISDKEFREKTDAIKEAYRKSRSLMEEETKKMLEQTDIELDKEREIFVVELNNNVSQLKKTIKNLKTISENALKNQSDNFALTVRDNIDLINKNIEILGSNIDRKQVTRQEGGKKNMFTIKYSNNIYK